MKHMIPLFIFFSNADSLSPFMVFTAGLISGLNPCLLAILAFMISILLTAKGRMKTIYITLAFSLGIFVVYLLVGIGLFRAITGSSMQEIIKLILVLIIFLLGLWHIYDSYYISKKEKSSFTTPKQIINLAAKAGGKASYPQAFLLGMLFSLVKAPCVGAIYFAILELIIKEQALGLFHLAIYNFGLVLPVIILGCAMALGLSPEEVDRFRKEKRAMLRLITGIVLISLALLLAFNLI